MFDREAWLAAVGTTIGDAIQRRDTKHAIFHGCYDWHSAVHGHWALLRIGRVLAASGGNDERFVEAATAELTPDRVATEAKLLRDQPSFEMPYGRAWFLRLAIEHAQVTRSDRLRAMADEVARSLLARFDSVEPHPNTREYGNSSWALAQLAAYARAVDDREIASSVQGHVEAGFLDAAQVPDFATDRTRGDFFSLRGNWLYLIATTQRADTFARVLDAAAIDERTLAPVTINGTAHHYGMNWSRAWALHRLALVAPADRELFRSAYDAHVAVGVRDHERGAGDYHAYGHWVPQFAVYALTEDAS